MVNSIAFRNLIRNNISFIKKSSESIIEGTHCPHPYEHMYTPIYPAMATAAASAINGAVKMGTTSQAYLEGIKVKETKSLIAELCRQFYHLGWVSGTGGSITIKVHDDSIPKRDQLIVMSPSGTSVLCV